MDTFSLPFRFTSNGLVSKHAQGTDSYFMHILSNVLQTEPKEMPLDPNFGTNDPLFQKINKASIVEVAAKYVPEMLIDAVSTVTGEDGTEQLVISYRIQE
jgi:hypothetical protein